MKPINFDQWKAASYAFKSESKNKKDRLVRCSECHGKGIFVWDRNREHCGVLVDCESCDGSGKFDIKHITEKEYNPSKKEYFNDVISNFKMLADWQDKQLFDVMGSFVKEFRGEHKGIV